MAAMLTKPVIAEYLDAHLRVAEQVAVLSKAFGTEPAESPDDITWGHVGSLNEANRMLAEVIRFLQLKA